MIGKSSFVRDDETFLTRVKITPDAALDGDTLKKEKELEWWR